MCSPVLVDALGLGLPAVHHAVASLGAAAHGCARLRTAAYACDVHGVRVLPSADGSTHARAQLCFSDRLISQIHCCLIAEPPSDAGVEACAVRLQVKVQDFSRNGTFGEDSCVRASSFSTRFHSLTERVGGRSEW